MAQEKEIKLNAGALITKGPASRILKCTPPTVINLFKRGELPAIQTGSGMRLFNMRDVIELAQRRQGRAASAPSMAGARSDLSGV